MGRNNMLIVATCLLGLLQGVATAQEISSEILREEMERLRVTGRLELVGVEVASPDVLAEFYERRRFEPAWTRPGQVEELLELIVAADADGLDPDDYHLSAVARTAKVTETSASLSAR